VCWIPETVRAAPRTEVWEGFRRDLNAPAFRLGLLSRRSVDARLFLRRAIGPFPPGNAAPSNNWPSCRSGPAKTPSPAPRA
jgi:hypothetical protein